MSAHLRTFISSSGSGRTSVLAMCGAMRRLEEGWGRAVGSKYAHRTRPIAIEGATITVASDSAAVLGDIKFKKNAFIAAIRSTFKIMVEDMRFVIAPVHRSSARPAPRRTARRRRPELSEEQVERARSELLSLRPGIDSDIAEAIARCMAAKSSM